MNNGKSSLDVEFMKQPSLCGGNTVPIVFQKEVVQVCVRMPTKRWKTCGDRNMRLLSSHGEAGAICEGFFQPCDFSVLANRFEICQTGGQC